MEAMDVDSARQAYLPAALDEPPGLEPFHLNGTQDMITLFDLHPLYDCAVRPYLKVEASEGDKAPAKRQGMSKSFAHYVEDLPGMYRRAYLTQRELEPILMKPEYTYTPIVPFDGDVLKKAFTVEPATGPIPGIDLSLLEADEHESPAVKKNKQGMDDRPDAPKKRVVLISKKKRV